MRDLRINEQKKLISMLEAKHDSKLKVAIYARKSREDTSQTSLDTQVKECQLFISRHSSFFDESKVAVFKEDNVSGMKLEGRDELAKLLDEVRAKKIDVVVVTKIDRLSRDSMNTLSLIEELNRYGCYLIAGDDLGDDSAAGILIKQVMWATAEFLVRRSIEDMMIVKSSRAKDGYAVGGPANYGYRIVNKQYVQDPQEASVVAFIFDSVLNGKSYADIADSLEAMGIRSRTGKKFSFSTINGILTNERNYGMSVFNSKKKRKERKRVSKLVFDEVSNDTAIVDPIVSKDDFDRVQELLKARAIPKVRKLGKPYFLTGKVHCTQCGELMTGDSRSSGKSKSRIRAYACKNNKLKDGNRCSNPYINADHLERFVKHQIKQIYDLHTSMGFDQNLLEEFKAKDQYQVESLERKNLFNQQTIDKLALTYSLAKSSTIKASVEKQISDIDIEIKATNNQLAKARKRLSDIDNLVYQIRTSSNDSLFSNSTLLIELINDLNLRVDADKDSLIVEISDDFLY